MEVMLTMKIEGSFVCFILSRQQHLDLYRLLIWQTLDVKHCLICSDETFASSYKASSSASLAVLFRHQTGWNKMLGFSKRKFVVVQIHALEAIYKLFVSLRLLPIFSRLDWYWTSLLETLYYPLLIIAPWTISHFAFRFVYTCNFWKDLKSHMIYT